MPSTATKSKKKSASSSSSSSSSSAAAPELSVPTDAQMLLFKQVLHRIILDYVATVEQSSELNAQKLSVLKRHLTHLSHSVITKARRHVTVTSNNLTEVEPVDAALQARVDGLYKQLASKTAEIKTVGEQVPGTVQAKVASALEEIKTAVQRLGEEQSDQQQPQQPIAQLPSKAELNRVAKVTADIEHSVSSLEKALPSFLQAVGNLSAYFAEQHDKERPVVEEIMNGPPLSSANASGKEPSTLSGEAKRNRQSPY